jgi:hypothetical protein
MIQSTKPLSMSGMSAPCRARRRERAGQRHADGDVGLEHLLREQLAGLAQPRGVVGLERAVDELLDGHRLPAIGVGSMRAPSRNLWFRWPPWMPVGLCGCMGED